MQKKTVYVVTADDAVFRKIELLFRNLCHTVRCRTECPEGESVIIDADTAELPVPKGAVVLSRGGGIKRALPIPFSLSELKERVLSDERPLPRLSLILGDRKSVV